MILHPPYCMCPACNPGERRSAYRRLFPIGSTLDLLAARR